MELSELDYNIEDSTKTCQSGEKKDWISLHGSDLLKASLLAGYSVDCRYLEERLAIEHPGFFMPTDIYLDRTDSPPEFCLEACGEVDGSYCSNSRYQKNKYFFTVENYLGKHTIVREIAAPAPTPALVEIVEEDFTLEVESTNGELDSYECEKKDWIFSCGSDVLQQSFVAGYDSTDRYVRERLAIEHPGFVLADKSDYKRADSPPEYCLQACLSENSYYCSEKKYFSDAYFLTIDDYLGKHQIVKEIQQPSTAIDRSSEQDRNPISKDLKRNKSFALAPFVAAVATIATAVALVPLVAGYFPPNQHPQQHPISKQALEIEAELAGLRMERTRVPEVPGSSSKEELTKSVTEELESLSSQESSIKQEIKLNRKLLKELESKP